MSNGGSDGWSHACKEGVEESSVRVRFASVDAS